jgi:hypothetical protein
MLSRYSIHAAVVLPPVIPRPSPLFHNYRSPDEAPRNPGNLQGIAIAAVQV